MAQASHLIFIGVLVLAAWGAIWDIKTQTIPNKITIPLITLASLAALMGEASMIALTTGGAIFIVFLICRRLSADIGGGDGKMAVGLGILVGPMTFLLAGALMFTSAAISSLIIRQKIIKMGPYMVGATYVAIWAS